MARKKGKVSQSGVKLDIIKFILENNGPVEESQIREHLKKTNEKMDQGNVNRHLHELEKLVCIELTQTIKKGLRKYNLWDITNLTHLKKIKFEIHEIQLNPYEKSLNIVLHKFGIGRKSSRYVYFFILLRLSASFFNTCMNKDIDLLQSRAREIFNHDKGFKNEERIKKHLNECNAIYIKGKLNFEISEERFRKIMEELSLNMKDLFEEYAYRVCHCRTELEKENLRKASEGYDNNIIDGIVFNMIHNQGFGQIDQKIWIESFHEKFTEKVPELFGVLIETILETPDEYQNMYLKIKETLSLIIDQNETLERSYLDLLFEHFYYQDILDGVAYRDEKTFAQNSKKIIEEYYALRESKDIMAAVNKLVLGEMENISKVIAKYKIPSILDNISDDSTDVLHELLNLYGYQCLLKDLESRSVE